MKRFEILTGMHMGPIKRHISRGDVIAWDLPTRTLTLNGNKIEAAKGMDLEECVAILERQVAKDPEHPWSKELEPVNVTMAQLDVKTETQVVLPILGCLKAAEDFLGEHEGWAKLNRQVNWTPSNEDQYQFLKRFIEAKKVVDTLGDNLKRKASRDVQVINDWLKENGFEMQLVPESGPVIAVASILDVLVEWVKEGKVTSIQNPKGRFPAVAIKGEDGVRMFINRELHPFPIAMIRTKSGDLVYMSVLDYLPLDTFALTDKVDKLRRLISGRVSEATGGVIFPMVDYDRMVDIGWIRGMSTGTGQDEWYIGQAIQQTKFRMNEKGAHAKSAVAMTLRCMACAAEPEWVVMDRPFILWFERPGVEIPLFAGVFAEDVWKKPAEL